MTGSLFRWNPSHLPGCYPVRRTWDRYLLKLHVEVLLHSRKRPRSDALGQLHGKLLHAEHDGVPFSEFRRSSHVNRLLISPLHKSFGGATSKNDSSRTTSEGAAKLVVSKTQTKQKKSGETKCKLNQHPPEIRLCGSTRKKRAKNNIYKKHNFPPSLYSCLNTIVGRH